MELYISEAQVILHVLTNRHNYIAFHFWDINSRPTHGKWPSLDNMLYVSASKPFSQSGHTNIIEFGNICGHDYIQYRVYYYTVAQKNLG